MTFTHDEEQRLEAAIAEAESMTSGEIRLHVEDYCNEDALTHARKAFDRLGMNRTADRNAVMVYVALIDHQVAIYGDEGIHQTVGLNYWASLIEIVTAHARKGDLVSGLTEAILELGRILKRYYPHQDDDVDELDNTISYGNRPK
jgi:uncharacterized membrane protein